MVAMSIAARQARAEEPAPPDFNQHIAPLFNKYCAGCHDAETAEGDLVLTSYDKLLAGGGRGAAITPGKSDQSRLLLALEGKAEPSMPPKDNEAPTAEEIALIKAWIDAGAKGPEGAAPDPTVLITPKIEPQAQVLNSIQAAAYSPDGKTVALAGYRTVRLLSPDSRAVVRTLDGHAGGVTDVAFSADGKQLIAAAGEPGLFGEAKLWDVESGTLVRTFRGHRDSLYAAVLSPDGKLLATAGYDHDIKLWDVASGEELRTLSGHNGAVFDLAFSPDGKILASASDDATVKLWDVATGERLDTFGQPQKGQYTVVFSPDGRRVAAAGIDNRIRVWELSENAKEGTNRLVYARFAHQEPIIKLAYASNGKTLASAAEDGTVKLWNAEELEERRELPVQSDWTPALSISPDGGILFVGRHDGTFDLYGTTFGQIIKPAPPELADVSPRGIERGVATRIELTGKNLLAATALDFKDKPFVARILSDEEAGPDRLWAEVTPAADLTRGSYEVAVVTEGGTSKTIKLEVDDVAQVVEAEPNDNYESATPAALPAGIWGRLSEKGDVDHYRFDAQAGQTLVFDLAARRIGSKADAVLTLFGPQGLVVANNHHFNGEDDALLVYQVPNDGQYTLCVGDLQQDGSNDHFYRLSAGPFAFVTGCYPLSVPPSTESEVELTGYNLPSALSVNITAGEKGNVNVPVDPNRFRSRDNPKVVIGQLPELRESEPNDTPETATVVAIPAAVNGRTWMAESADGTADVDLFRFTAKAGQQWVVETDAARRGSPIDTKIEVLDAEGKPIERLLLEAVRDSSVTFRPIDSQNSDVRVVNWEEMHLNQLMYMQGEVCKIFRMPRGPDSGISYYISGGKRRGYFDTSATAHALDEPCYIVEPHPVGTELSSTGLPVFPVYYANDDDALRKLGRDSRLAFTTPADGDYLVRVTDVRDRSGDRFAYRLIIREPRPDFKVTLGGAGAEVPPGGGRNISFTAERIDGFDGEIQIDVAGLPEGYAVSSPVTIEAGHLEAAAVLTATPDAKSQPEGAWSKVKVTATAHINDATVTHDVNDLGTVKLADKAKVLVRMEPAEVTIHPGTTVTAILKIERIGHDGRTRFEINNLPHGVIVDNIGLNGVLIPEGQTQREIFFSAEGWVPDGTRQIHAVTIEPGGEASPPITFHVRKPTEVAAAEKE